MKVYKINHQLSIAPQFEESDFELIEKMNIDVLICNRPDNEDLDQPLFSTIKAKADLYGIQSVFAPMTQEGIQEQSLIDIYQAVSSDKKILMYCRSGQRCAYALIYALAFHKEDYSKLIKRLSDAGFHING